MQYGIVLYICIFSTHNKRDQKYVKITFNKNAHSLNIHVTSSLFSHVVSVSAAPQRILTPGFYK